MNLFTYLSSDGFVNKDSIFKNFDLNQPDVSIKIQDHDSTKNNNLRIYFSKKNNKMYGLTDRNKDLLLLNPQVFKFVFINKKYFSSKGN